jgi:hypothetical protein
MRARRSAASRVPFGGFAALDTASAPRWSAFSDGRQISGSILPWAANTNMLIPDSLPTHPNASSTAHWPSGRFRPEDEMLAGWLAAYAPHCKRARRRVVGPLRYPQIASSPSSQWTIIRN